MNCNTITCSTFQRVNPRKGRPSNSGDTATTDICDQEQRFENIFNPFSRSYKRANKNNQGKSLPNHIPYAKVGSGALNRCNTSCRITQECQVSDNDNSLSVIDKDEQTFENIMRSVRQC